jgi:hypothetical protein
MPLQLGIWDGLHHEDGRQLGQHFNLQYKCIDQQLINCIIKAKKAANSVRASRQHRRLYPALTGFSVSFRHCKSD